MFMEFTVQKIFCSIFNVIKNYFYIPLLYLFDEVEVLDYAGPFEVFSLTAMSHPEKLNRVLLIGPSSTIATRGSMLVNVDYVIGAPSPPDLDILLVPGGYGTRQLVKDERVMNWIKASVPDLKFILSVCTGSMVLGHCGIVDGKVITTHHTAFEEVEAFTPKSIMCKCRRFIDNDPVYTSAGISAGIDLSLYFVKKHFGLEIAKSTVDIMEYAWTDPDVSVGSCSCGAERK